MCKQRSSKWNGRHFHFVSFFCFFSFLSCSFLFFFFDHGPNKKKKLRQQKDSWKVNQLILGASKTAVLFQRHQWYSNLSVLVEQGNRGGASFYTDDDGVSVIRDMEVRKRSVCVCTTVCIGSFSLRRANPEPSINLKASRQNPWRSVKV